MRKYNSCMTSSHTQSTKSYCHDEVYSYKYFHLNTRHVTCRNMTDHGSRLLRKYSGPLGRRSTRHSPLNTVYFRGSVYQMISVGYGGLFLPISFCCMNIMALTLVLLRGVVPTPLTVFALVLKIAQPRGKIAPWVPSSSSFPFILAKKFRTYHLHRG